MAQCLHIGLFSDPLPTYPFGIGKPSILTLKREDVFPEELAVASMKSPAKRWDRSIYNLDVPFAND